MADEEGVTQVIVGLLRESGCLRCQAPVALTADGHISGLQPVFLEHPIRHVQCTSCGQYLSLSSGRTRVLMVGASPPRVV